jgi:hypothetical protein
VLSDREVSWAHDLAVIQLYREFETLMRQTLVGAINNDSTTASLKLGVDLPKHLSFAVCEYLVTAGGYFDFKGRDGLLKELQRFVPKSHYLVRAVGRAKYKSSLEQLCALRNFAVHDSRQAKATALKAVGQKRMLSAGSWLKRQRRLAGLVASLCELAGEIESSAPY